MTTADQPQTEKDQRLITCNVDELSGWLDSWLDELGHPDVSSIGELERYAETLPVEHRPVAIPPATATPECVRSASCEDGDHTYSWPCIHATTTPGAGTDGGAS